MNIVGRIAIGMPKRGNPCCMYFSFSWFPNRFGIPPGTCLFLFQPDTTTCKKIIKNVILLILSFRSQKNRHFLGLKIKRNYFNGGWKKKFAAKRCNFYIRCIKTPVNDQKSKQDKNLQNPLRIRAKNKRSARKYPLRENTLHHPTSTRTQLIGSM